MNVSSAVAVRFELTLNAAKAFIRRNTLKLRRRQFRVLDDVPKVKAFLLGRERWPSLPDYWNAGKSTVGTFQTILDSPAADHEFWHDQRGDFHAYLWVCPHPGKTIVADVNSWRMFIHPRLRTKQLSAELLVCAEVRLHKLAHGAGKPIRTVAYDRDTWLASLLEEHGYTKQDAVEVYMQRNLEDPIGEPDLASGYQIRALDVDVDVIQRSGVQSDAFNDQPEPDDWSIENTKRFIFWYEGREDLDLVAVSAIGEIASFAVFLVDPITLIGELDPVGTRASHRRRGLSKAVLLSGLKYLKLKGLESAVVRTGVDNESAIRLYQAVGFRT